jgi:hypothetical protein
VVYIYATGTHRAVPRLTLTLVSDVVHVNLNRLAVSCKSGMKTGADLEKKVCSCVYYMCGYIHTKTEYPVFWHCIITYCVLPQRILVLTQFSFVSYFAWSYSFLGVPRLVTYMDFGEFIKACRQIQF